MRAGTTFLLGAGMIAKGLIFLAARMYQAVVPVCSDA
jgi:hypothetical protein